jgi:hypothetical protein
MIRRDVTWLPAVSTYRVLEGDTGVGIDEPATPNLGNARKTPRADNMSTETDVIRKEVISK